MVAKVAGSRATTVGKSADVLVVGVPSEWINADSEISPIAEIAAIVPEPGQVWFVCANPHDVSTAARIVQSAVEDGAWTRTRPRYLDATEDVGGAVGDLVGDLLAKRERVVVSDVAGVEPVRWAIRRASGYAGIPLLTIGPQREVYVDQLKAATSSLVLGALRFALTAKPSDPSTTSVELHERGFTTLVKAGQDDTYERTLLLDALLADLDLARSSDYSSACAELLERRGFPEDARRLRDATQYWIQQRLWDANFVPEMVLHNEAHSASVDRNVASLCEPLLDIKEDRPIDELDLLVLAFAAWLHDWGHASASAAGIAIATNPIDVRNFHGIFSAARLAGGATEDKRHEIDERFAGKGLCADVYKKGQGWLAKDVALLCAHHQGWTSCGDQRPGDKSVEDPDSLGIKKRNKPGFEVPSFDEDHAQKVGGRDLSPSELHADLDRAHLRLAILRVADAADVGVHRVPDYRTQQAGRDAIAKNIMEEQKRTIRLILEGRLNREGQQVSTSDLQAKLDGVESVIAKAEKTIREMAYQGNLPNEEDIKRAFKDSMPRESLLASLEHAQKWKNPFSRDSDAVSSGKAAAVEVTRRAYKYGKHLVTQRAFYDQHEMVRAAIPVLLPPENKGDEWKLVVNVIPNLSDAPDEPLLRENWEAERTERAVRYAMDIVAREFGAFIQEEADGSTRQRDSRNREDRLKQDIAGYLENVRISKIVHGLACPVLPSPDFELPEFGGEGSLRTAQVLLTRVLPHVESGWLIGRPDGVQRSPEVTLGADSAALASSLTGERIATVLGSGKLWLNNADCEGRANEYDLEGLAEPQPPAVLAVGAHMNVLLTSQSGAAEYGLWTNTVVRKFEASDGVPFVKGFFTPAGPILVDRSGGVHGDDTRFAGTRVADLDMTEWNRSLWTAMLPVGGNAVRVTCWRDAASQELPPVAIPRSPNVRIAWARGTSTGPPTLTIAADSTVERRRLAADGSGWEE